MLSINTHRPKEPPRFGRARPVAHALSEKGDAELDELLQHGIIHPVKISEWAAHIVPLLKPNGAFRIRVNSASKRNKYPLPQIENLYCQMEGGNFSKLDLSSAFQQIPLDEDSRIFTTLNTNKGQFQYTRPPFGISFAPSIFQRVMDGVQSGLQGVPFYIDDITVAGKTEQHHL